MKTPSVRRFKNIQVIITDVRDMTGTLQLTWYKYALFAQCPADGTDLVFRGRVVKKRPADHGASGGVHTGTVPGVMHSMQPVWPDKGTG